VKVTAECLGSVWEAYSVRESVMVKGIHPRCFQKSNTPPQISGLRCDYWHNGKQSFLLWQHGDSSVDV